ncbi:MAG: endo-1,4-beta-xylanase [Gemmatimonadota bacterium]|nr:MAG: endo-1,4-beta-xylanase [Gemmatimonadota bacterium]
MPTSGWISLPWRCCLECGEVECPKSMHDPRGVTDAGSWKNNWPIPGRTNYPLLFDREGRPKPAFESVIRAAQAAGSEPPN